VSAYSPSEILVGVVRELRRRHLPVGTQAYLDAARALRLGFGGPAKRDLKRLCAHLWARNERDARAIDEVFELVPNAGDLDPESETLRHLLFAEEMRAASRPAAQDTMPRGAPEPPNPSAEAPGAAEEPRAGIYFDAAAHDGGLALPRLEAVAGARDNYVFRPQSVIANRELAVIWRRLRKMGRSGARLELDISGTIRKHCDEGALARPVLRQQRRNGARLRVLFDASPSMAPWQPFADVLSASLSLARLQSAEIGYFSNVPRKWVFAERTFAGRVAFEDWVGRGAGAGLLVVGDAGAARGHFSPDRAKQMRRFVSRAAKSFRPIVWINPMPSRRWSNTSATALERHPGVTMLPLDKDSLIRAVDILRGVRLS
jgi:uncharacterized protein with von Willebrand factor type A (vWA) domain